MIARAWHGVVPVGKADAYHQLLLRTGVADYQSTPGNRGVYVFRRVTGEDAHFLLVSLWESMESIRAFAGPDVGRARYYPEDKSFLIQPEPHVIHYDVLVAPDGV